MLHEATARSRGAGGAAQAAVWPPAVRVGHRVERVAAFTAGRPAGAAERPRPGAADKEVRGALLNGPGVPGAGAAGRRLLVDV